MSSEGVAPRKHISNKILKRVMQDRLWLHAHPEIAYQEFKTADYVRNRLKGLNIPFVEGIAGTGIVAEIRGQGESDHAIGLRADMDALPMKEENKFAHCSKTENGMHGCGHDGHMAIMIGVAEVLSKENDFGGVVHLIFQPAEEGHAGAQRMIEEGLFERFPMKQVYALHNWPNLSAGEVGTLVGPIMASSHYMGIKIIGRGGHGAMPHQATPQMTETVLMEGACRLLDSQTTEAFYRDVPPLIQCIASAFGAKAEVDLHEVYPTTDNDAAATEIVRQAANNLGMSQKDENTGLKPSMASEDFSFMLQKCPGCYFWLGQGGVVNGRALHQPTYDFNDDTIGTGVELFTEIVKTALPL